MTFPPALPEISVAAAASAFSVRRFHARMRAAEHSFPTIEHFRSCLPSRAYRTATGGHDSANLNGVRARLHGNNSMFRPNLQES